MSLNVLVKCVSTSNLGFKLLQNKTVNLRIKVRQFCQIARSQHILATLAVKDPITNPQEQRNALYDLIQFIEKNPMQREQLIKDGALDLLENMKDSSQDPFIIENTRLGLALLGWSPPLPTNGIRILSIDGGGIRGVMVMELLMKLEKLTGKRIFELFDLCMGVSTGAILVCALAAEANMTVLEGMKLYKSISRKMFHKDSTFDVLSSTSRLMWSHAYYDTQLWESFLKKHIGHRRIIDTSKLAHCPKICCISTTVTEERIDAHVFRNYALPPNVHSVYNGSHTPKLWEVVRASSAAPAYFGDFPLNGECHQDGGVLFNNPASVAIHEAKLIWPNEKINCVVSLGTGRNPNKSRSGDGRKMINPDIMDTAETLSSWKTKFLRILDSATDTEQTHVILADLLPAGTYFRFNPYLTEWLSMVETRPEKIQQLENDAFMYFRKNEDKFEQVAEILTKQRTWLYKIKGFLQRVWLKLTE